MGYERKILAAAGFDPHATTVALCTYQTFMLGLFRSHAYLHVLMGVEGNPTGVRGDRVRRFGDKIGLIEMIDFAVEGMNAGLRASGTSKASSAPATESAVAEKASSTPETEAAATEIAQGAASTGADADTPREAASARG